MDLSQDSFIQDFPPGDLDFYRKQATFNWKKLKLVFEDPQRIKTKNFLWSLFEKESAFKQNNGEPSIEEQKQIVIRQLLAVRSYNVLPADIHSTPLKQWLRVFMTIGQALVVVSPDAAVKLIVDVVLAHMSIILLGNDRQKKIGQLAWESMRHAAFMLTEVAHGSDTRNMQTTATYNEESQEFILDTPNFQAAKCWSGNLGMSCTIGIVFAQLYVKGSCYGLHAFLVPIRHPGTYEVYSGITIKDMGLKLGLNGVDNAIILFHKYKIPRSNLLNKFANVTADGRYITQLSSPGKVFGSTIGNLSTGRVSVVQESSEYLICAVVIAVRYAAVRKQFGANKDEELAIIEHQLHQWRLFPHLAAAAVLKVFATSIADDYINMLIQQTTEKDSVFSTSAYKTEMHVILSAAKPLTTWSCQDAIQQCREACGGHAFLNASRFGVLRNSNDARVTYEGDNNILLQQTSRWLLKLWDGLKQGVPISTPLGTCNFLNNHSAIRNKKCTASTSDDVKSFTFLQESFEWLITYLLQETSEKLLTGFESSGCLFTAFNNIQVYKANVLSMVYIEYVVLSRYWSIIHNDCVDISVRRVSITIGLLYGLSCLDKHLIYLYEGGFTQPSLSKLVKDAILDICSILKCDAVAVADALSFPDSVLNSVLAKSDGKLYENLRNELFRGDTCVPEILASKL